MFFGCYRSGNRTILACKGSVDLAKDLDSEFHKKTTFSTQFGSLLPISITKDPPSSLQKLSGFFEAKE